MENQLVPSMRSSSKLQQPPTAPMRNSHGNDYLPFHPNLDHPLQAPMPRAVYNQQFMSWVPYSGIELYFLANGYPIVFNCSEPLNQPPPVMASMVGNTGPAVRWGKASSETASWLPWWWEIELKTRVSGKSAGVVDKYYIDPISGKKCRSKREVMEFIETGAISKRRRQQ